MKPAARRRIERELTAIMKADGDNCSICSRELPINGRTFGGITKIGKPQFVGECCKSKLSHVLLMGVFVPFQDFPEFASMKGGGQSAGHNPADIENAISAWQEVASERSDLRKKVALRAGLDPKRTKLFTQPSDWKADDAAWFEANPHRSHRLRAAYDGEFDGADLSGMPDGHFLATIVRQIQPGMRVREPFGQQVLSNIADDEATIHALFDIVAADGTSGALIPEGEVRRRAEAMRDYQAGKPN